MRKRTEKRSQQNTVATQQKNTSVSPSPNGSADATGGDATKSLHLEAMVANTSDAMIVLDEHFQVLDLNPAAFKALGGTKRKLVGRGCAEVLRQLLQLTNIS